MNLDYINYDIETRDAVLEEIFDITRKRGSRGAVHAANHCDGV